MVLGHPQKWLELSGQRQIEVGFGEGYDCECEPRFDDLLEDLESGNGRWYRYR